MNLFQCEIPNRITAYFRLNEQVYVIIGWAAAREYKATMNKHYGEWKVA